jgi:hypothetical protein
MAAIKNDRDIALQAAAYRSKQAAVTITADTGSFLVSKNTTTVAPSTITLTATPSGNIYTNNAVYKWSYCVGNISGTYIQVQSASILSNPNANKLILNSGDSWAANPYVYYKCEISEPLLDTALAYYTITYTKEPQDPLTINLLRTNVLVTCDSNGTPINFNNTDQIITVIRGTTALVYSAGTTTPNSFNIAFVANNLNVATGTGTGTSWTQPAITGLAQDGATITYTVTVYDSAAIPAATIYTKTVVYNKISNGVIGANGADGANLTSVVNIDFAGATLPSGVSYSGTVTGTDSSTTTSIKNLLANQSLRLTNLSLIPYNSYIVNMRVKWISGTTWAAKLLYTNSARSEDQNYYKTIPQPPKDVWTTISLDMRSLTAPTNSTDYMTSTVTSLCFSFFSDTSSEIVIDYITVGKYGVAEATKSNTVSMYVWAPALVTSTNSVIQNQTYTVTTVDSRTTLAEWRALFSDLTSLPTSSQLVMATATGTLNYNSTVTPAIYYTGAFTYTWSGGTASAYPIAYYTASNAPVPWTSTAGSAPASGYILYQRNLTLTDVSSAKTTSANWSSSVVNTIGYRNDGTIGSQGDSYRIAYIVTNGLWATPTTPTAAVATSVPGSGDLAPTSTVTVGGITTSWSKTATANLTAGQYMYQTDGILSAATGNITWGVPYISNLKVGSLQAISANLGTVSIASGGSLASGKTSASDSTNAGFFLGNDGGTPKLRLGSADNSSNFSWDGTTLTANSLSLRDSEGNEYLKAGANLSFSTRLPNTSNMPAENATVGADWKTNVSNIPYDKIFSNDAATTLGFNPSFEAWTNASAAPDSWTAIGTVPTKETAIVRFGTNAVKYIANSETSLGITKTASWTNPMPVGSFVNGTVDFYLVAITSGLPGIIVSLYTDVALTTSYSTLIQPNSALGQWQRIPFTARVASNNDLVYGIKVEVLASSSLFTSGRFKGTVIFDSLNFGFFDSTIDNKQIAIVSNGTLVGAGGGQVTLPGMGQNTYRVVSRGNSVANFTYTAGVYSNYTSIENNLKITASRSYTLTVIARSTGLITKSASYDVFASVAQATALATALNACDSTVIVVVSTYDEPQTNRLQTDLLTAMYRCGASSAVYGSTNSFKLNSAYILVGIGGCGQGNGAEAYQGSIDSDTNAWCDMSFSVVNGQLTGVSGNYTPTSVRDYGYTGDIDATKGAPSGTSVAGVLAETVNANIAAASTAAAGAVTTADLAKTAAAGAVTAAGTAKTAADTAALQAISALSQLSDIASDSILTPGEKPRIIADFNAINLEQTGIIAQATAFSITTEKTAYTAAVSALTTYLSTLTIPYLWSDTATEAATATTAAIPHTTTINATDFRAKFQTVYTARQALLNAIYAAAKALSDTALSQIVDIVSDKVLTPSEKSVIITNYNTIIAEQTGIDAQATTFSITTEKTAYDTAVTALTTYLTTLNYPVAWNLLSGNTSGNNTPVLVNGVLKDVITPIDSATFRTKFQDVYTAKQALLNKIAAVAATTSLWTGVTGTGKPEDYATKGADSSNLKVGIGGNLCYNSNFAYGIDGWDNFNTTANVYTKHATNFNTASTLNNGIGENVDTIYIEQANNTVTTQTEYAELTSTPIPVVTNNSYALLAYSGAVNCKVAVFVYYFNSANEIIGNSTFINNDGSIALPKTGGSSLSNYYKHSAVLIPPVNTTYVKVVLRKYATLSGKTSSYMFVTRVMLQEVGSGATEPGPWSPSGISNGAITNLKTSLDTRLDKTGADILTGPITLGTGSAILVGSLTTGLYLGTSGIVGINNGITTFAVDELGNAIFAGNLTGASGEFAGSLRAGVLDLTQLSGVSYVYSSAGTFTINVPVGKTTMRVSLVGGGGGGGGGVGYNYAGAGGGGGGYISQLYESLTAGLTITITVGAGGAGGPAGATTAAGTGGTTKISYSGQVRLSVTGGGGGGAYNAPGVSGGTDGATGGIPAFTSSTTSSTNNMTGNTTYTTTYSAKNGGSGGKSHYGVGGVGGTYVGYGGTTASGQGKPGGIGAGGGGGGGGFGVGAGGTGGTGGTGYALIEFFDPNTVILKTEFDALKANLRTLGVNVT